ncbi:hypothetical protein ACFL4N_01100 [Thermodesulfobacteriota bacterium]
MPRELTDQERGWLVSGLKSLSEEHQVPPVHRHYISAGKTVLDEPELIDPKPLIEQIDGLLVVSECRCGQPSCHTVQFQHTEQGKLETIVNHYTDDGRMLNIDINEETGFIAGLEVI